MKNSMRKAVGTIDWPRSKILVVEDGDFIVWARAGVRRVEAAVWGKWGIEQSWIGREDATVALQIEE
ncbi:hypothetical protein CRG98_022932 [Punica granatum]|uniref:Uncharacterized protein n=1 Tax=Punica granatum TaxID=22663 RepID=A0A2I0JK91_PUNGR|nr:hypothetical protein CRG98_022932 [Punica granatum]